MSSANFLVKRLNQKNFGYVILVGGLLGLQNYSFGYLTVQPVRQKVFNDKFLKEHVEAMHKRELGQDAITPLMGYPDMGAGRLAKLLPYGDWFKFNCAQRVHQNSIEHLAWSLPLMLFTGIFFPRIITSLGITVFAGREFYRYGYTTNDGPNSNIREIGAISLNAAEFFMIGLIGVLALRYFFGPFFNNRKFVQKFKLSVYDRKY